MVQRVPRNLNLMTTQESPKLLLVRVFFPGGLLIPNTMNRRNVEFRRAVTRLRTDGRDP